MKTHCILRGLGHRYTAHDERKEGTLPFAFRLIKVLKDRIPILHYNQLTKNYTIHFY